MSRKHSKVKSIRRHSLPPLSPTVEKSDKRTSPSADEMEEKSMTIHKSEKSSRIMRKQQPTHPRLAKRQPTMTIKMAKHQCHPQLLRKKSVKNSTVKLLTKRRQSTVKSGFESRPLSPSPNDYSHKKMPMKKISTMTMRNKPIQSMGVVTKTTVIKTDEENSRMKSKQQRDDSKQHRTAERTATTKSKQQQPGKKQAAVATHHTESMDPASTRTTAENPMYVMDENQMIELFKSFLKNISYQPKIQPESEPPTPLPSATLATREQLPMEDKDELEELNAEMIELFGHINTVHSSYQEIVQSLISIQKNNRHRKTTNSNRMMITITKQPQLLPVCDAESGGGGESKQKKESMKTENHQQPPTLEPYMNPTTRNESFNQLFQRVDRIRYETEQFRSAFTPDGTLKREIYDNNKVTYGQFNRWRQQIQELAAIVELILQEYNREVLELFRLSQTMSEY